MCQTIAQHLNNNAYSNASEENGGHRKTLEKGQHVDADMF